VVSLKRLRISGDVEKAIAKSPLPLLYDDPVRARPKIARAASRRRSRASSGASVATTSMQDPSPRRSIEVGASEAGAVAVVVRGDAAHAARRLKHAEDRHAGDRQVAAEVRLRQHADHVSTAVRRQLARRRADAAFPAVVDRAGARADRPLRDRHRRPHSVIAAITCSRVTCRPRMSFSPPSFVSPTSALTDRTRSLPGCAIV
jgi:hypothetical protein